MAMLNEFLRIVENETGEKWVRCVRCENDICPVSENHRLHLLLEEGPVQAAGPHVNPHHLHGDKFVFRQFYCPHCVALLSTEVALRGESILWDIEVEV